MKRGDGCIRGTRPWASIDAQTPIWMPGTEGQRKIDICLEQCPYPDGECVECMAAAGPTGLRCRREALKGLLSRGATAREISEALGVSLRTAQRYRKGACKE